MQMGHLGQAFGTRRTASAAGGDRFRIIAPLGGRAQCPAGSQTESSGRLGTNQQYVWCYRAPAPVAAPRAPISYVTYQAPITTVSPTIQAQISPQVSPVLTQMQASPGASVTGAPTQYQPGGQTARGGMTAAELQTILASQRSLDDARRAAEQLRLEEREAARQQAEAEAMERARESAGALPPTAGAFVPPSPMMAPLPSAGGPEIDISSPPVEAGQPIPYLLLAGAAVGAALLLGGKKGARKR